MVYYKETTLRFLVWNLVEDLLKLTLSLLEYERTRKRNGQRVFLCCILFRFELWLIIVLFITGPSFLPSILPACPRSCLPVFPPSVTPYMPTCLASFLLWLTVCFLPLLLPCFLIREGGITPSPLQNLELVAKDQSNTTNLPELWGSRRHNSSGHWVP